MRECLCVSVYVVVTKIRGEDEIVHERERDERRDSIKGKRHKLTCVCEGTFRFSAIQNISRISWKDVLEYFIQSNF